MKIFVAMYNVLGYVVLGFYVIRQQQGKQWQDTFIQLFKHFLYFCKFCKHWTTETVLVVYQMPYIYWWLMKDYSMTPKNMYTISQLNDRCLELLFCYMCYYYMSLFMCAGCMCCLFLQVDRLSCTLNSLSTQLSSHNALYTQTNIAHNIQQNTNNSQLTSSQFTLNKNTNSI